jgi:hypothetical protein
MESRKIGDGADFCSAVASWLAWLCSGTAPGSGVRSNNDDGAAGVVTASKHFSSSSHTIKFC